MINIERKEECCGCTACAAVCMHNAIRMTPDALGFVYPQVDQQKCVECGLCEKVCSFHVDYDTSANFDAPEVYGVRHKDLGEVMRSRSGAAFVAMSDYILEHGGIVYGVGYKEHFRVSHKRATTKEERDEFRGSKYVQSDLTGIFRQVKEDLKNGMLVLFSGTGCQVAGLKSFVGAKLKSNLILVDIVCHGVPSPYIWRDYLSYLEKKYKSRINTVNFRNKQKYGWKTHRETYQLANGKEVSTNIFTRLFSMHLSLRPSCGNCHFCNTRRSGDVTIADFWKWEKSNPTANTDNKGLSLLLINTKEGKLLFDAVKDCLNYFPARLEDCLQNRLKSSTVLDKRNRQFAAFYEANGLEYAIKRFGQIGWQYELLKILKKLKRKLGL